MDISSRHLPELSDMSVAPDLSDASFQIPVAVGSSSKLLLVDESLNFMDGADLTLNSPRKTPRKTPKARGKAPMLLAELTPRSRPRTRSQSPKKRAAIPPPFKQAVSSKMSVALGDTPSPFKPQEVSFQIPAIGKSSMDFLMEDDSGEFFGKGITASFMEEPASPRAHEPLTLSQLSPGPKSIRSPSPVNMPMGSSRDVIDVSAEASRPEEDLSLDVAPVVHSRLPSLFSNLKAEIETLVADEQTPAQDDATCPAPLASDSPSIGQSIEEPTKNAADRVEVRSAAPHVQKAELAPSVPHGSATRTVSVHGPVEDVKSTVIMDVALKDPKPESLSAGPTADATLPGRRPDSQPQLASRTTMQVIRNQAPTVQTKAAQYEYVDAGTTSGDVTMSEAGGLAAALVSYTTDIAQFPDEREVERKPWDVLPI